MLDLKIPPALRQFVDDELLRSPLLFDQIVDGTLGIMRAALASMSSAQRTVTSELLQSVLSQRPRMADYFMRSLREQLSQELARSAPKPVHAKPAPQTLALVDEDVVAVDVELAHIIETIKSVAEYELRELRAFVSALVGDMDVAADYNPFRPEVYARTLWDTAQILPISRGHQFAFLRHAGSAMAQALRRSYAAASTRIEATGIEPASYRTLILPAGSRRGGRFGETTFSPPDLQRMRDTLALPEPTSTQARPGPALHPHSDDARVTARGSHAPQSASAERAAEDPSPSWHDVASRTDSQVDRQSIELVGRLFDAMAADPRVPTELTLLISRLHAPALRLTLLDSGLLDQDRHPLWQLINLLVYEAEMVPDPADPERVQLLATARSIIDKLAAEPEQTPALYLWALQRLEAFLQKRLLRRLAAASSQMGTLHKLEERLLSGNADPSSLEGALDVPQLDTVPAELLTEAAASSPAPEMDWLESLRSGDWVRLFLQGRWVQARLLWVGPRREIWLFGDGASDATWAVRHDALALMRAEGLAKTLRQRSIVGSAAARLQDQLSQVQAA
jgi:hypothetical protein